MAGAVQVVGVSGTPVRLHPPATEADDVQSLRGRVAAALGVPVPGRIGLLCGGQELADGSSLQDLIGTGSPVVVSVMVMPCAVKPSEYESYIVRYPHVQDNLRRRFSGMCKAYVSVGTVQFPPPQSIDINMMPFIIGDRASIPEEYQHYWPLIEQCSGLYHQAREVGYLTIQEGRVEAGNSQRRPGLHLETPGLVMRHGGQTEVSILAHWGKGDTRAGDVLYGGIYMASNVPGTSVVWNAQIKHPELMCGTLGDMEHVRDLLGEGSPLEANELVWMTDTTPHESLPLQHGTLRQFFRVVSSAVSVWYERHSTKNRLGVVPDPALTEIVADDKFATWGQTIAERDREELERRGAEERFIGMTWRNFQNSTASRAQQGRSQQKPQKTPQEEPREEQQQPPPVQDTTATAADDSSQAALLPSPPRRAACWADFVQRCALL